MQVQGDRNAVLASFLNFRVVDVGLFVGNTWAKAAVVRKYPAYY